MGGQHLDAMGFSLAVTCVPAFAMAVGSFALTQVDVSVRVGAALQNLAAGLLLGAVASELFPLLAEPHSAAGTGGLTIGFALGLSVTYGTEALGEWLEVRSSVGGADGRKAVPSAAAACAALRAFSRSRGKLRPLPARGARCG